MIKYKIYNTDHDHFLLDGISESTGNDVILDQDKVSLVLKYYSGDGDIFPSSTANLLGVIAEMLEYGDTLCIVPYDDKLDEVNFLMAIMLTDCDGD